MKRRIPLGRCISLIGWPLSTTTWASSRSMTVISRSTSRTLQTRPRSFSMLSFRTSRAAPPTPVAKNAQAFYQWGLDNNYPPIGFYSAYPGLSVQDIRALLADRKSQPATSLIALRCHMVTNHDQLRVRPSAKECSSQRAPAMKGPGLLRRLLGRGRHEPLETDGDSAAVGRVGA